MITSINEYKNNVSGEKIVSLIEKTYPNVSSSEMTKINDDWNDNGIHTVTRNKMLNACDFFVDTVLEQTHPELKKKVIDHVKNLYKSYWFENGYDRKEEIKKLDSML